MIDTTTKHLPTLLAMLMLTACGGGGGGSSTPAPPAPPVNVAPTANNDSVSVIEDNVLAITPAANDTDSDGSIASLALVSQPSNGALQANGLNLSYTPNSNFVGADSFTYNVTDDDGATSGTATVNITVDAITATSLTILDLNIPTTGYASQNNAELNANVFTSENQTFTLPPNTVSYGLYLVGDDVDLSQQNLFISGINTPSGTALSPIENNVSFCDQGFCGAMPTRIPGTAIPAGDWLYNLGTLSNSLNGIDLTSMTLKAAVRQGPTPDTTKATPATLKVKPFISTTSISQGLIDSVLAKLVEQATANKIAITLLPTTVVADARFQIVSTSFNNQETADLVTLGDADAVNIFFVEDFSNNGGTLGISSGIPGSMGVKGSRNGVLINASANRTFFPQNDQLYINATADVTLHEMGHFLGLYHTTESDFSSHDVLSDTPECTSNPHDQNGNFDGRAGVSECPDGRNIMFPGVDFTITKEPFTANQQAVIFNAPIATP